MKSTASKGAESSVDSGKTLPGQQGGLPRSVEVLLAVAGLLVAAPVIALLGLAIRLDSKGPVFFRQKRVGRGGSTFEFIKLRTMVQSGGSAVTASGDGRVTRVGSWMRRAKLDELPGMWNVLRGEVAWVGPRPEVPEFVDLGDVLWCELLRDRPGLTDPVSLLLHNEEAVLATILVGRPDLDPDRAYREVLLPRKLRLWLAAQRQRTTWSDLRILVLTAFGVLGLRGDRVGTIEQLDRLLEANEA